MPRLHVGAAPLPPVAPPPPVTPDEPPVPPRPPAPVPPRPALPVVPPAPPRPAARSWPESPLVPALPLAPPHRSFPPRRTCRRCRSCRRRRSFRPRPSRQPWRRRRPFRWRWSRRRSRSTRRQRRHERSEKAASHRHDLTTDGARQSRVSVSRSPVSPNRARTSSSHSPSQRVGRRLHARASVPVARVVAIALLAVEVGVDARGLLRLEVVDGAVRRRPVALAVQPQRAQRRADARRRFGRGLQRRAKLRQTSSRHL